MFMTIIAQPPFTYTTFSFLLFNLILKKTPLCHLMLKAVDFFWLWVSWVSFACWFFVFLNFYYFFFFFYYCTTITTGTITTITSSSVSKGKGTPKTSYKLWSSKFRNFGGRKEWVAPKLVLLLALGLGSTHTHTRWLQYKICIRRCNPTYICFPCTRVWRLTSGLCTLVCFWACSHVMNSPCSSSRKLRRRRKLFF